MGNYLRKSEIKDDHLRIAQEFEMNLYNLEDSSKTIKELIDTEHSFLEKYLRKKEDGKNVSTPSNDTDTGPCWKDLNEHELRAVVHMQNVFCTHACKVNCATKSLRRIFNDFRQTLPELQIHERQDTQPAPIKTRDMSKMEQMQRDVDTQFANQRLQQQIQERDAQISKLQECLYKKEQHEKELNKSIANLKKTVQHLQREGSSSYSGYSYSNQKRMKVSATLYTPRKGDLLDKVTTELRGMLVNQCATQNTDLFLTDCDKVPDIAPDKPVIVICINASRLGTDVSSALQGLQYTSQIAVVILHHKEVHALPNQSSERILTSAEYKTLGGIFDMAFISNRGLYTCDFNNKSLSGLIDFIKQRNN